MHCSSKETLNEFIKPIFTNSNRFPKGYINDVDGWGISKEELHSKLPDGTYKLLTLDIDFGHECSLRCRHCFRKSNLLNGALDDLNYDEIMDLMKQGKELGLKSVKFLGAGEPFEEPELLRFLEDLRGLEIKAAIFTKGHVLGSDELTEKYFGNKYGIRTADELIGRLRELDVSILLGFNSFIRDTQEDFIGIENPEMKIKNFVELRDKALINLVKAGFNEFVEGQATRLALIIAPIKPENVGEVFDIYKWGRVRNMYTLSCPTTYSGLGKQELLRQKKNFDFEKYLKDLTGLYVDIYKWNIKEGLMTVEQFEEEGVSLYPGCHPCNQVAAGFYITLKGKVIRCPGRDEDDWVIIDDIRKSTLKDIWINSPNYRLASTSDFNFDCRARDGIFFAEPKEFYPVIKSRVLKELRQGV